MMRHPPLILVLVLHLLLLAGYCLASDDDPIERYEQHEIAASSSSSEGSSTTIWEISSSANSFENSETNNNQESRRRQQHSLVRGPKATSQIDNEIKIVPLQSSSSDLFFELDSCSSHQDCYNCSQTTRCHWCQHDQQCHLMGSIHGCVIGEQCNDNNDNNNDDNKHHRGTSDACSVYQNCSSCSATRTCHWCAHDEACHVIGSVYGCVRGVDCFAEDRCRRATPEPLAASFTNMDHVALVMVGLVGGFAILILSCCFCLACGVKGSYDDLMTVVSQGQQYQHQHQLQHQPPNLFLDGSISTHPEHHRYEGEVAAASETTELLAAENNDTETPSSSDASFKGENNPQNGEETQRVEGSQETSNLEEGRADNEYFYQALEEEQQHQHQQQPTHEDFPLLPTTSLISHAIDEGPPRIHGSKHARRMISACSCIYFLMVAIIGGLMVGAVRLFPKIPEYSVCNDSVAWKKLFDGLVKLKTEVDFEILMSIENANHIDVVLDQGKGIFRHGDAVVGHYTVPPVLAPAMSIIDILVLGTLTPDRGQAIALAKEYYKGQLILDVDADLMVRSPAFFNVSKQVNVTGRKVDINAAQDRHLCNCKDWDSNSTAFAANFVSATLGDFYNRNPLTDFRDS